jgi:LacI family transcriptional regulator
LERAGRSEADLLVIETPALNVTAGQRAGSHLAGLPAGGRPTAVFCANDLLALGVLQEMTTHRIAVPEGLAIVGYDDVEFAAARGAAVLGPPARHQLGWPRPATHRRGPR